MAQEDNGLVWRGLLLLTAIGLLVAVVLAVMFWRVPGPAVPVDLSDKTPSAPGWEVRYNAATALARRGSESVPWPLLREMLDEKQQLRNYQVRGADGRDSYDESAARASMIGALRAIAAWHEKQKTREVSAELRLIYSSVDKLAESPSVELKVQAEKARAAFFR